MESLPGKPARLHAAVLPAADGREGDAEGVRQLLLGEPDLLPEGADEVAGVRRGLHNGRAVRSPHAGPAGLSAVRAERLRGLHPTASLKGRLGLLKHLPPPTAWPATRLRRDRANGVRRERRRDRTRPAAKYELWAAEFAPHSPLAAHRHCELVEAAAALGCAEAAAPLDEEGACAVHGGVARHEAV